MKILVTGGSGFLGKALIKALLKKNYEVKSFNRREDPELKALNIESIQGDLSDLDAVMNATKGCSAIFHTAAKVGLSGKYKDFYSINVIGSQNILTACAHHKIKKLIYTSSPSVVDGKAPIEGADETHPFPTKYYSFYSKTKGLAENAILTANSNQLATISLRPRLIWGPGDHHLFPRLLELYHSKRLRFIGDGSHLIDTTYIDDAVNAHLLAFEKLECSSVCSGKAYFISQDNPISIKVFINKMLQAANLPPINRSIPFPVAFGLGFLLELFYNSFRINGEPPMTRFKAIELGRAHWYNIFAAKQDLSYNPQYSIEEGMKELQLWHQKKIASSNDK